MAGNPIIEFKPQSGPQTQALQSSADILIFGGSAGGGKTYILLLEPLRHYNNSKFGGVIFRRNTVQVRNPGGLWDESSSMYGPIGIKPYESTLEWEALTGWKMKFSHLENEKSVLDWQGSQLSYLGFDEVTHFTEKQFWYMLSRLRSMAGIPGYVRATCNPDCDSWVRRIIDWWIGEDGYPIPQRSGILRWFIRRNDHLIWGDTRQELIDQYGKDELPKSLTFIPSKVTDNKILLEKDPAYLANLRALSRVDRMRLELGNWNVRASAGNFFKQEWFPIMDTIPAGWAQVMRFWDRAASKPSPPNPEPDWTRGLLLYKYWDGTYCIADLKSARDTPGQIETLIKAVAAYDGYEVSIMCQQDPGSAGVAEAEHFIRMLQGYDVRTDTFTKDKVTRAKAVSAQCEAGNIRILRASWNHDFFTELENFPEGRHDDIVDTLSGAFNALVGDISMTEALWRSRG